MALTSALADGTLLWTCAGCGATITAHASDSSVQWLDAETVQLPTCARCGEICAVKAVFSSDDLQDPNAVGNPSIAANQQLAQLLQTAGKMPPTN